MLNALNNLAQCNSNEESLTLFTEVVQDTMHVLASTYLLIHISITPEQMRFPTRAMQPQKNKINKCFDYNAPLMHKRAKKIKIKFKGQTLNRHLSQPKSNDS